MNVPYDARGVGGRSEAGFWTLTSRVEMRATSEPCQHLIDRPKRRYLVLRNDSLHVSLRSSSSQLVIRRTRLSSVHCWRSCVFRGLKTPLEQSAASSNADYFFGAASKFISLSDHFLPNCFWFLVLYTVYSSGLVVLYLRNSKYL